jgi:hypothetical protein
MSISRVVKPWIRLPSERSREFRRARRMALEALENRTALAGGLDLSVATVPAELGSASVALLVDHGAVGRDASSFMSQQQAVGGADSSFAAAGSEAPSSRGENAPAPAGHADAVVSVDSGTTPTAPAAVDGGQSTHNPSTSPSQSGSGGGGTTTPPNAQGESAAPATTDPSGQLFQAESGQAEFDPGLLDPLAWTVTDDEPFGGDGVELFDGEEPLPTVVGASNPGLSRLIDRPDEIAIGGTFDYHSADGWRDNSFVSLQPGSNQALGLRDLFKVDPRNDSLAAARAPWRGLLNGLGLREESGLNDHEHIAELSPLAGSAPLALAATLWSTPSWSRTGPGPERTGPAATKVRVDLEPGTSSWKVLVMGLDRAFDRSYAEVRRGLSAERGVTSEPDQPYCAAVVRLEWRGAILPAAALPAADSTSEAVQNGGGSEVTGAADSFVPAVIELGELLLENLLNPVFGHEHGGDGDSQ